MATFLGPLTAAFALFGVLVAGTSGTAVAQEAKFSAREVEAHVRFLADDLLEGRATGTRGYDLAARYVATRLAAAGFKPGAVGGSWYQPVPLRESVLAPDGASVTVIGPGGRQSWAHGTEVLLGPDPAEETRRIEAPAVFVGFGIDRPDLGFRDYDGLDVKGRIVVLLSGVPKGVPSDVAAHLRSEQARTADAKGAIGAISIDTLTSRKTVPWARRVQGSGFPAVNWIAPDGKPFRRAPGILASASLNETAAAVLFSGAPVPLDAVLAEAEKEGGRPKGFALPTTVRIERTSRFTPIASANVLGLLPGSDPKLKDEVVLLTAHLDHLGIGPERNGDKVYNGALDNAAGVATLLEVARVFGTTGKAPKRSIMVAALTGEEKGLLGAEYLSRNLPVAADKVVAVVNLDMPLLLYPFTDVIAFGAERSTLGPAIAAAAGKAGIALAPDPMPDQGLFTRSDHYRFVERGIPSVFLVTGHANGGAKAFLEFLRTNYHQPGDDADQPIDWEAGAKFALINWRIAREVADAPDRPRWYKGDFFADTFAPKTPRAERPAPGN